MIEKHTHAYEVDDGLERAGRPWFSRLIVSALSVSAAIVCAAWLSET